MGNGFFTDHPGLGALFDFNRDGDMSLGEAGAMGAMGSMAASEFMRASQKSERESGYGFDAYRPSGTTERNDYDDLWDDEYDEYDEDRVYEVDYRDKDEVFEAIISGDFDEADCEYLVHSALHAGVKFEQDEIEEILEHIRDSRLRTWVQDPYFGSY